MSRLKVLINFEWNALNLFLELRKLHSIYYLLVTNVMPYWLLSTSEERCAVIATTFCRTTCVAKNAQTFSFSNTTSMHLGINSYSFFFSFSVYFDSFVRFIDLLIASPEVKTNAERDQWVVKWCPRRTNQLLGKS